MASGVRLALEAIAHDLSLTAEDPEIAEIESLLVQTQQVWANIENSAWRTEVPTPGRIEPLLAAARHSLSNGDSGLALEDVRDAVDVLRDVVTLLPRPVSRDME